MLKKEKTIMSYEKEKKAYDKMVQTAVQECRKRGTQPNRKAIEARIRKVVEKSKK